MAPLKTSSSLDVIKDVFTYSNFNLDFITYIVIKILRSCRILLIVWRRDIKSEYIMSSPVRSHVLIKMYNQTLLL